jgi:hypothetical protein
LVRRDVQHLRVVVEDVLRTVSVVYVPVDDDDTFALIPQPSSRNGNVVHQTKAHRSVSEGVMTGRPNESECPLRPTRINFIDRREHGTGRSTSRFKRSTRCVRIGIKLAPS